MSRPWAWVAAAFVALVAFALPSVDPAAIAVQRIPSLLLAPLDGGPASAEGDRSSMAARLIEARGQALPSSGGGGADDPARVALDLGGVRFAIPGAGSDDLTIHGRARRAAVAALRDAAAERGARLELRGEHAAIDGGVSILFTLRDGRLEASARALEDLRLAAQIPSPPVGRSALFPSLLAVVAMGLWRRPLVALLAGVLVGACLLYAAQPAPAQEVWGGFVADIARRIWLDAQSTETWKPLAAISALLATWAVVARNGGLGGWTLWLSARARGARRAQLAIWIASAALFVAPPQKSVALGWFLRGIATRARLSSEKLAWLLDSTASAVFGLCLLSPLCALAFHATAVASGAGDAAQWWWSTLPWRGFCWITLALGLWVSLTGRDFGPMLRAERRAREGMGPHASDARRLFAAPEGDPHRALHAWRAVGPISAYVLVTLALGLRIGGALDGGFEWTSARAWLDLGHVLASADTSLIASLAALLVALTLSAIGGAERGVPAALFRGWIDALRPCAILLATWILAWFAGQLGAAEWLAASIGDRVAPQTLPALAFLWCAAAGFVFGSPWAGAVLTLPVVLALARAVGADFASDANQLAVISVAAALEGAIAGALVSPLSTASLSASVGSGADHVHHLRTQTPYALLAAASVLVFLFLPAGLWGLGALPGLALAVAALIGLHVWLGRASERRAA